MHPAINYHEARRQLHAAARERGLHVLPSTMSTQARRLDMQEEVAVGDLIVDRATLRDVINKKIAAAKPLPDGRWQDRRFRIATPRGRNIVSAAIYRSPDYTMLFCWIGSRCFSFRLKPAVAYSGRGW